MKKPPKQVVIFLGGLTALVVGVAIVAVIIDLAVNA